MVSCPATADRETLPLHKSRREYANYMPAVYRLLAICASIVLPSGASEGGYGAPEIEGQIAARTGPG